MKPTSQDLNRAKFLYLYIFFVFLLLNKLIISQYISEKFYSIAFASFAAAGCLLLLIDLLTHRDVLRLPYGFLLLLFLVICGISSIINVEYGLTSNIKTLVWTAIQMFLLTTVAIQKDKNQIRVQIRILGETLLIIWGISVLWSLGQFMLLYGKRVICAGGYSFREGLIEGRLFGCFTDPNYAAVISIVAIIYAVWAMLQKTTRISMKLYYGVQIVSQFLYIILSGSRTASVVMAAVFVAMPVLFATMPFWKGKFAWLKVISSLCAVLIGIVAFFSVIGEIKSGLSNFTTYLASTIQNGTEFDNLDSVIYAPNDNEVDYLARPDVSNASDISNHRTEIWHNALQIFAEKPVFGTSPRNHLQVGKALFGDDMFIVSKGYGVHNGFLAVLVCTGIAGGSVMLLWYVMSVICSLRYLFRNINHPDDSYYLMLLLISIILCISIASIPLMGIFFTNSVIEVIFWSCVGYLYSILLKYEPDLLPENSVLQRVFNKIVLPMHKKI